MAASICLCCSTPHDHMLMEADRGHETGSQRRQKEEQHGAQSHDSSIYVKTRSPQLCRWILVAFVVVVLLCVLSCRISFASLSFTVPHRLDSEATSLPLSISSLQLSPFFSALGCFARRPVKPLSRLKLISLIFCLCHCGRK